MDESIAGALVALNRQFYEAAGHEFEATRRNTWPGFERAIDLLRSAAAADPASRAHRNERPTLLDLGCGNGRFARFLADREPLAAVVGFDASQPLLEAARASFAHRRTPAVFLRGDLLMQHLPLAPHARFDRVALIGVVHHLPAAQQRLAVLRCALERVRSGGSLIVTFWQVAGEDGIAERTLDAAEASRVIAGVLGRDGEYPLPPNDRLVTFGERKAPRFVHECDAEERAALLADLPARLVAEFQSDARSGRGNVYWLLTPRSSVDQDAP